MTDIAPPPATDAQTGAYHYQLIARALPGHSGDDALVTLRETSSLGYPAVELTVRTTLPIAGMFGPRHAWEVSAHAPIESFD